MKRFIAGAVCPKCSQQDSLYVEAGHSSAFCVNCGYEMLPTDETNDSTHVSAGNAQGNSALGDAAGEEQAVQWVTPTPKLH